MSLHKIIPIFLVCVLLQATSFAKPAVSLKNYTITDNPSSSFLTLRASAHPNYRIWSSRDKMRILVDFIKSKEMPVALAQNDRERIKSVNFRQIPGGKLRMTLTLRNAVMLTQDVVIAPDTNHGMYLLRITVADTPAQAEKKLPKQQASVKKQAALPPAPKAATKAPIPIKPMIVIDAGHGGHDPGSVGRSGKYEKWITLEYAKALNHALLSTKRYRTHLTRSDDTFVDLQERVRRSETVKGDLFIAVHADSHNDTSMRGLSVYTLSETASDKEAENLAAQANASGTIGSTEIVPPSGDVAPLLVEMVQRDTKNLSASFAENLVTQLQKEITLLPNTHRFAGFRVLTGPSIPSVLIELGYLSNPKEEALLQSPRYKKKLVSSIAKAIDVYFDKYRKTP